ncbi:hypothetical protein G7Y89_g9038 [Cudoniella acicularis]|uniref:Uncharacterized protein n=1 Tax=Cudoniella acicularis TaxID=354080 RepID=A0A8H4RHR0_9HELO|nr:hypothetical protein G7Y89_g9038 [Cudoniella acicularis]
MVLWWYDSRLGFTLSSIARGPAFESRISASFGNKLDILINCAGYMAPAASISSSDDDEYWRTFEINLRGTYRVTKAFLPLLLSNPDGLKTIVNFSSIAAHNLRIEYSAYGISKYAILRFTEFLMAENAGNGLLTFCVHPGAIMTKLAERMPKAVLAGLKDTPEMAADTIVFLTQERREWLAGRYLSCTWDVPELLARETEIVEGDKLKMRMVLKGVVLFKNSMFLPIHTISVPGELASAHD